MRPSHTAILRCSEKKIENFRRINGVSEYGLNTKEFDRSTRTNEYYFKNIESRAWVSRLVENLYLPKSQVPIPFFSVIRQTRNTDVFFYIQLPAYYHHSSKDSQKTCLPFNEKRHSVQADLFGHPLQNRKTLLSQIPSSTFRCGCDTCKKVE